MSGEVRGSFHSAPPPADGFLAELETEAELRRQTSTPPPPLPPSTDRDAPPAPSCATLLCNASLPKPPYDRHQRAAHSLPRTRLHPRPSCPPQGANHGKWYTACFNEALGHRYKVWDVGVVPHPTPARACRRRTACTGAQGGQHAHVCGARLRCSSLAHTHGPTGTVDNARTHTADSVRPTCTADSRPARSVHARSPHPLPHAPRLSSACERPLPPALAAPAPHARERRRHGDGGVHDERVRWAQRARACGDGGVHGDRAQRRMQVCMARAGSGAGAACARRAGRAARA
ncbi:hypothetical protein GGX14DRAFT_659564 [Mycena pura]|uniref:Uncharacterized protein n=1 Tax=Mycena pura TaxID=153505 RepID=A0AAD6V2W6_9AGAR|nr:hypothetical protein GGX14DRAFT_659564 [Mycena pura]